MARGVARMMGFRLMLNFNNPYLATGLGDFWSRWHISLSTWFRDYVYIPLGGNRAGAKRMYLSLLATVIISGLWHGAAWTFLVWGALHGVGLVATRGLERSDWYCEKLPRFAKQSVVFLFVCFTWIFFRAESMPDAWLIIARIFGAAWTDPQVPLLMLALVGAAWAYQFAHESRWRTLLQPAWVRVGLVVGMLLFISLCSSGGGEFIYFQF
jgi:D-alanyl-lipoteichoic acid acyltransferase DltB (MBOAT superfamily)